MPAAVATPLPPRKLKYSGYRWPITAAMPTQASSITPSPSQRATSTGSRPLPTSPSRVRMASFFPATRSMLVAPGLPEPLARGSWVPNQRLSRTAKEREPSR